VVDLALGQLLTRRAKLAPDAVALRFEGGVRSYSALAARVDRLAAVLSAGGVRRSDRVGFVGRNHPAFLEALFAAAKLGAPFVPLNFRLTGAELKYLIDDAGIHTLIADDEHRPAVDRLRAELSVRRYIGAESGTSDWEDLERLIAGAALAAPGVLVHGDDPALVMYTSGTAGKPRGVLLTHANLHWNTVNVVSSVDLGTDEVTLVVAPLFHIGGLNVNTIPTWHNGGQIVLHRSFDAGATIGAIAEHRVTQLFAVPAMYALMSQHPAFDTADFSSLRLAVVGGAPVPKPLLERYLARGIPFVQGYGLTETSPVVSFQAVRVTRAKFGSAGLPMAYTEVAISDERGGWLPPGSHGEIRVRGPNVMQGYWNQPDATAAAIDADGWLRTGDLGWLDDEGYLYVGDRLKDVVISGGENVSPAEVEEILGRHPKVREIAVIGLRDEQWGEAVTAVVAIAAGQSLSLDELRAFAAGSLAAFKLPTRLYVVPALPRNTAGKVLKVELRNRFS
jgi:fatty-acyl-CoA synthase